MDYATVYREHAEEYDALVSAEDCDGNLVPQLAAVAMIDRATIVDVGTGTGRVARALLPRARFVIGVEPSPAMLAVARARLQDAAPGRFELHEASAESLPIADGVADLAVAGWVFGHLRHWMPDDWRTSIARALTEMSRVTVPGGALVVIETLGTGRTEPSPPNAALAEYYTWLEEERGFARAVIRTDYLFPDVKTAAKVCGFFFGEEKAQAITRSGSPRVPECTGVWSRGR